MEFVKALKSLYYKAEDKYYAILDYLGRAGIPVYKVVDAIESQNIPSFPVAIVFSIVVLVALVFVLTNGLALIFPPQSSLTIIVQDSDGIEVNNAIVTLILPSGEMIGPEETDSEGKALFTVPLNQLISIEVQKEDYEPAAEEFTADESVIERLVILEAAVQMISKTIHFYRQGTTELIDEDVTVFFSCSQNSEFSETATAVGGVIEIDVPSNCGSLTLLPQGGYNTTDDSFDVGSGSTYSVYLAGTEVGKGTVVVEVKDSEGTFLSGIDVSLIPASSSGESAGAILTKTTAASGTVAFTDITAGRYYVSSYDPTGNFAEYDGRDYGDIRELQPDGTVNFTITLTSRVVGKIKVLVKDKITLEAISDAEVTVSKQGSAMPPRLTDSEGKVVFNVGENVGYEVVVDKIGYLIETLANIYPSDDYREALLRGATASNSQSLTVTVLDEVGEPVEDARLRLKKIDSTPVGSEIITGVDGRAVFERVEEGDYYVYAYKPGFGEDTSDTITLSLRQENTLTIVLPIGSGSIEVNVLDEEMNPVAGATVKVINFFREAQIGQDSITDSDGYRKIDVRADKTIYLIVTASDFLPYKTIPIQMARDVTKEVEINLVENIPELKVEFLGLFVGEESIRNSLAVGKRYTAKLKLFLPEGSTFSEAVLHLRTGAEDSKKMEKDELYIASINAPYSSILKGTSYNPPLGYSIDAEHLTSGNSKWANLIFDEPGEGVIEIEASIQISEGARRGNPLYIWYRTWGKAGGYVRYPPDSTLGTNESVSEKQALYAQAKLVPDLSVGPSTYCDEEFCSILSIKDIGGTGLTTSVIDEYPARISNDYRLSFNITSLSETLYAGAELQIVNDASALAFGNYDIRTITGARRQGNVDGSELSLLVGDMEKNDVIIGILDFRTKKEGPSYLILSLVAENQKVFEKKIRIGVSAAERMKVEILPKIIVPYIPNNLLVKATDLNGSTTLSNATVTIKKDGEIVASGETDSEGIFAYSLAAPSAGSVINVLVEKNGYKAIEKEIKISENILEVVPSQLKEILVIGSSPEKEIGFYAKNLAEIPLTVKKVEVSADFKDYIKFDLPAELEGYVLDVNSDVNVFFNISIDRKGLEINKPGKIEGSVNIYLENSDYAKSWATKLPLEVRIGFGKEVDDSDCFHIYPTDWEIFTGTETKSLSVTVKNDCTVGGEAVVLRRLQARQLLKTDNELGEFSVSADIPGSAEIALIDRFQTIAEIIEEESLSILTVEFRPDNIVSGASEIDLMFRAINRTEDGDEELGETIKVKINLNDLAECVEVKPTKINIDSCPFNLGYGNYGNRFGSGFGDDGGYNYYNPYQGGYGSGGGYGSSYDPYESSYGYGTGTTPYVGTYGQLGRAYPYGNYSYPYYNSDYGSQMSNYSWSCGYGGFEIKNNCSSEIAIDLDVGAGIMIEEEKATIGPGEEYEVSVQPAYMVGLFKIDVGAKIAGSEEPATDIATVQVNVESELTKTYRDCISVSPARKLKFNNFMGKPVTLKILNDCYNSGVRLQYSNNTINFGSGYSEPEATYPAEPYYTPTSTAGDGTSNMIDNWAIIGEDFQSGPDGSVTQILEFEVIKSVNYRQNAPPFPTEGTPFQVVGGLRYFMTRGYYAVEGRTNLSVNFYNRWNRKSGISFPMVIEDWWAALPYGERIISYGDPTYTPDKCIRGGVLDLTNVYAPFKDKCIPKEEADRFTVVPFNTKDNGGAFNFATKDARGNEKGGCGTVDRISQLLIDVIEKNGMKFIFSITGDGHEIEMRIDKTNWNGRKVIVNDAILAMVTRAVPAQSARVAIPVKLCILGEEEEPIVGPEAIACENGATGLGAYEKFGFDKLLLDWRWKDKYGDLDAKNLCDGSEEKGYFCDATQFAIALNEKAKLIKGVVDNESKFKCIGAGCSERKNSLYLHEWIKEQAETKDSAAGEASYVFYVSGNLNEVFVRNSAVKEEIQQQVRNLKPEGANNKDYILRTSALLEKLKNLAEIDNGKDIIIALDKSKIVFEAEEDKDAIEEIGLEKANIKEKDYYLMAFLEFYEFHKNLKETITEDADPCPTDTKPGNINCYYGDDPEKATKVHIKEIKSSEGDGTDITTNFMDKFNQAIGKGEVLIGIKKDSLSEKEKEIVMKKAKTIDGISLPSGYGDWYEFYKDLIDFNATLLLDGYSDDLRKDFQSKFGSKVVGKFYGEGDYGWSFLKSDSAALGTLNYAGLHAINLVYDWSEKKIKVIVKAVGKGALADLDEKNGTEYGRNPLFYYPIDGTIGFSGDVYKGDGTRSGYGTAFSFSAANAEAKLDFIRYEENDKLSPTPRTTSGSAIKSMEIGYRNKYANTESGLILLLTDDKLTFTPSDPIKVSVSVEKTSTADRPVGFLYYLNTGVESQLVEEGLINWNIGKDEIEQRSGIESDRIYSVGSLCTGQGTEQYCGLIFQSEKKGKIEVSSTVYVPTRVSPLSSTKMHIRCYKDRLVYAKAFDFVKNVTSTISGDQLTLNTGEKGRLKDEYTLKKLIERIKGKSEEAKGSVCVELGETGSKSLKLYWNPEAIKETG